jgi:hypothetical protein
VIYLRSQSTTVTFIAETFSSVASGNGARDAIDQIVAVDPVS